MEVAAGQRLHLALLRAGVMIETPCGSRGKCRKCRVRVTGGDWPVTAAERDQLSAEELEAGYRLSCQQVVRGGGAVSVVPELFVSTAKTGISKLGAAQAAAPVEPWYDRSLVRAGGRALGLAVDIGTTTVVAALLDLDSGEELAGMSTPNPQGGYGADLMSRLSYAIGGDAARLELQAAVVSGLGDLITRLCRRVRCLPGDILTAAIVGNTAMHHLFLGLPVEDLALAPYVPAVTAALERRASEIGTGLPIHPRRTVYALPNVAGFVGADAVAVMLACGLDQESTAVRMVADIGTNGEISIAGPSPAGGGRYRLVCCSAPAGPAFEGGEISQGMRAGPGAIEAVEVVYGEDGRPVDLRVGVIGGVEARGICGSGLLDAVAACVRAGLLDTGGRVCNDAAADALPPGLEARVAAGEGWRGLRLGPEVGSHPEGRAGVAVGQGRHPFRDGGGAARIRGVGGGTRRVVAGGGVWQLPAPRSGARVRAGAGGPGIAAAAGRQCRRAGVQTGAALAERAGAGGGAGADRGARGTGHARGVRGELL